LTTRISSSSGSSLPGYELGVLTTRQDLLKYTFSIQNTRKQLVRHFLELLRIPTTVSVFHRESQIILVALRKQCGFSQLSEAFVHCVIICIFKNGQLNAEDVTLKLVELILLRFLVNPLTKTMTLTIFRKKCLYTLSLLPLHLSTKLVASSINFSFLFSTLTIKHINHTGNSINTGIQ
jgi:hypothetical protein